MEEHAINKQAMQATKRGKKLFCVPFDKEANKCKKRMMNWSTQKELFFMSYLDTGEYDK